MKLNRIGENYKFEIIDKIQDEQTQFVNIDKIDMNR